MKRDEFEEEDRKRAKLLCVLWGKLQGVSPGVCRGRFGGGLLKELGGKRYRNRGEPSKSHLEIIILTRKERKI